MSRHDRAQGGGHAHGAGGHAPAATAGHDDITNGHLAVQNLEGSTLFPRISVWAAHAVKSGNFPAAREAAMRWYSNRPYLRTLAQSLDPSDRFVARAQALLDDMATLETQLPDMLEIGFDPESPHSRERWLARLGRAEKEKKQAQPEAAADAPPAVRSPLRPENVKSDGLDLGDLAAGALGAGAVLWADQNRDSINPVEHEVADVITKLTVNPAYTSGFVVGGIEGAWAAIKDNARLLLDIGEFFADMVKAQLIDSGLGMLRELRDKIASMIAAGHQVPAAVKAFAERWNDASDPNAQGHFQGHAVGYIAVQILIILATEFIPGGQYPGVVTALKLVADPISGLAELGAAMKAARLAKTAGKAAGKLEHAVEGAVAGERAGVRAAEAAAEGERAGVRGPEGAAGPAIEESTERAEDARGITFGPDDGRPATSARNVSLDGQVVEATFSEMSDKARHVVRQLEAKGWVRVTEIRPDELAEVSRWFGVEVAVVQSPYGKLRVVLGHERGVLTRSLKPGEVFVMHTHPVMVSKADQFGVDLAKAGKHVEAVVDWSGQVTYFSKSGLKNTVRPDGIIDPLLDYQAAFMDDAGSIVGYARIDVMDGPDGAVVKVRE